MQRLTVNAGVPGPRLPAACQDVMHFDQVCYDFPELRIVMRHGAEPWEALAVKLEGALPGRCEVDRHAKKLFSHDKVVRKLSLPIGDWRYTLEADGAGNVTTGRAKAVRGIVLKTEHLSLADWIEGLARDLSAEAANSEQARIALERLLT